MRPTVAYFAFPSTLKIIPILPYHCGHAVVASPKTCGFAHVLLPFRVRGRLESSFSRFAPSHLLPQHVTICVPVLLSKMEEVPVTDLDGTDAGVESKQHPVAPASAADALSAAPALRVDDADPPGPDAAFRTTRSQTRGMRRKHPQRRGKEEDENSGPEDVADAGDDSAAQFPGYTEPYSIRSVAGTCFPA